MAWQAGSFDIASHFGPRRVAGYTYRALGLYMMWAGSPKGRRPPMWGLYHLGSGHVIVNLEGTVATAFPIATEIAEAGDWDFLSMEGWKDRFPDAPEKTAEIAAKYPKIAKRFGGGHSNREVAMQIASNRP